MKKNIKTIAALVLALSLCFVLTACSSGSNNNSSNTAATGVRARYISGTSKVTESDQSASYPGVVISNVTVPSLVLNDDNTYEFTLATTMGMGGDVWIYTYNTYYGTFTEAAGEAENTAVLTIATPTRVVSGRGGVSSMYMGGEGVTDTEDASTYGNDPETEEKFATKEAQLAYLLSSFDVTTITVNNLTKAVESYQ